MCVLDITTGENEQLNCPYPLSVREWNIRRTKDDGENSISVSEPTLRLNNISVSDEGFYRCQAQINSQEQNVPAACILVLGLLCIFLVCSCIEEISVSIHYCILQFHNVDLEYISTSALNSTSV